MNRNVDGFKQLKAFYSWIFNNPNKLRSTHISLYVFLFNQCNRSLWPEWFKCPYDLAMNGACIGNKGTYYKCLDELKEFKLIDYEKGLNNYKSPLVKLLLLYDNEQLTEQVSVPLSEPVTEQVNEPLSELLSGNIYKLITNNYKLINDNLEKWIANEKPSSFNFKNSLFDLVQDELLVKDYIAMRKQKKASLSETAFNGLINECDKHKFPLAEALRISIDRGWQGFKVAWVNKDFTNKPTPVMQRHDKIVL